MISPIVVACLGILNCFFPNQLTTGKSPFRAEKKKKNKRAGDLLRLKIFLETQALEPMLLSGPPHPVAIRVAAQQTNLKRWPTKSLLMPSPLWFMSHLLLLMARTASERSWRSGPAWEVCTATGWGTADWLPCTVWDRPAASQSQSACKKKSKQSEHYAKRGLYLCYFFIYVQY